MGDLLGKAAFKKSKELEQRFTINSNHIFTNDSERDTYFSATPNEKTDQIFISVGSGFQQLIGSTWIDKTAVLKGEKGNDGTNGSDSQGIPTGGIQGQVLAKKSATNYDTEWVDQTGGTSSTPIIDNHKLLYRDEISNHNTYHLTPTNKGCVVIVDDGGRQELIDHVMPVLNNYGYKISLACELCNLGAEGRITIDKLYELYQAGHEVLSHSVNHPSFTVSTNATILSELVDSKKTLMEHGMNPTSFVYPFNEANDYALRTVLKYYRSGVGKFDSQSMTPPFQMEKIQRTGLGMYQTDTTANLKTRCLNAKTNGAMLVFMTHCGLSEGAVTVEGSYSPVLDIIEYCHTNNIEILTLDQALDRMGSIWQIGNMTEGNYLLLDSKRVFRSDKFNLDAITQIAPSVISSAQPPSFYDTYLTGGAPRIIYTQIDVSSTPNVNIPVAEVGVLKTEKVSTAGTLDKQTYRVTLTGKEYQRVGQSASAWGDWAEAGSGESSPFVINANHVFADNSARDAYFTSNPSEKTTGLLISVDVGYQEWDGSAWQDKTAVVTGPSGAKGDTGSAGVGVPGGGTTGQVLAKSSNTDYETQWVDQTGGTSVYKLFNDFINNSVSPWAGAAVSSGTLGVGVGTAKHPGVLTLSSSSSASSGYQLKASDSAFLIAGGEKTTFIFKMSATPTNVTRRMGFLDTTSASLPVDGIYCNIVDGVIEGATANNSTRSATGTNYTLTGATWYRLVIELNADATQATYTLYEDDSTTVLWTDNLTTNIPKVRETGHGDIATYGGTSAQVIAYIDYMDIILPNARRLS